MVRLVVVAVAGLAIGLIARPLAAESAKCVVVKKEGRVLTMDCGERGEGFAQGTSVKIKTDRPKQDR